jgi:hypothetical protein
MKVIRIPGLSWPIPKGLYHSAQRWTAGAKGVVLRWENVAGQLSTLKVVPSGTWHRAGVVQRLKCRFGRATAAGADGGVSLARATPGNSAGRLPSKGPTASSRRSLRPRAGRSPSGPLADAATPASWPSLPGCGAKGPCRSSGLRRGCRLARPKGPSPCSLIWLRAKTNAKPQAPSNHAPSSNSNLRFDTTFLPQLLTAWLKVGIL